MNKFNPSEIVLVLCARTEAAFRDAETQNGCRLRPETDFICDVLRVCQKQRAVPKTKAPKALRGVKRSFPRVS